MIELSSRGSGVVPYEAHNLETPVQFRPPQHFEYTSFCKTKTQYRKENEVFFEYKAGVAQWLEQNLHKVEVVGSNPTTGI